ncbi:MAG: YceI family protein [bacterium]|nr:YceI family protein [bacterium]
MRLLAISMLCAAAACLADDTFTVTRDAAENLVTFTSDAPLEEIVGKTNAVTGYVTLSSGGGSGEIHVDLASLDTGMSLRNKHMRDNHLETERFPEAVFSLSSLSLPTGTLQPGTRTQVTVTGMLALHGVTKSISPTTYFTPSASGDELTIEAEFSVLLQDSSITRPEFLIMKVAEDQRISVKLVAHRVK